MESESAEDESGKEEGMLDKGEEDFWDCDGGDSPLKWGQVFSGVLDEFFKGGRDLFGKICKGEIACLFCLDSWEDQSCYNFAFKEVDRFNEKASRVGSNKSYHFYLNSYLFFAFTNNCIFSTLPFFDSPSRENPDGNIASFD